MGHRGDLRDVDAGDRHVLDQLHLELEEAFLQAAQADLGQPGADFADPGRDRTLAAVRGARRPVNKWRPGEAPREARPGLSWRTLVIKGNFRGVQAVSTSTSTSTGSTSVSGPAVRSRSYSARQSILDAGVSGLTTG